MKKGNAILENSLKELAEELELLIPDTAFYGSEEPLTDKDARVLVVRTVLNILFENYEIVVVPVVRRM